jgi:hypothetical protein
MCTFNTQEEKACNVYLGRLIYNRVYLGRLIYNRVYLGRFVYYK